MSIMVTGARGFIGRHVVSKLTNAGETVIALDLKPLTGESENLIALRYPIEQWIDLPGRVLDPVTCVVHLASPVGTYGVVKKAGDVAADILSATHAAIEFCRWRGCPLVNVSTSEVYGRNGTSIEEDTCLVPARRSPRLAYAVGKLAAEMDVHSADIDAITIRPFNVAGPGQDPDLGFVIPRMIDAVLDDEPIPVFGDGMLERAFAHVLDVATFLALLAVDFPNEPPEVVNVGNPENRIAIHALARVVQAVTERDLGSTTPIAYLDGKEVFGAQWEEAAGVSKLPDDTLARTLGWKPWRSIDAIVRDTLHERQWTRQLASAQID
jgi:nucleoside-diphosphate-sugar epimerase